MIDERGFPSVISEAVKDWTKYKMEKRQGYKPTGFKSFLSEVENRLNEFGEKAVVDIIRLSMSNNWQGVAWDKLKEPRAKQKFDMGEYLRQEGGF